MPTLRAALQSGPFPSAVSISFENIGAEQLTILAPNLYFSLRVQDENGADIHRATAPLAWAHSRKVHVLEPGEEVIATLNLIWHVDDVLGSFMISVEFTVEDAAGAVIPCLVTGNATLAIPPLEPPPPPRWPDAPRRLRDVADDTSFMGPRAWFDTNDPLPMLEFLGCRLSERKTRLLACAGCRQAWHLLKDVRSRACIEASESWLEGGMTEDQRLEAANLGQDCADELDLKRAKSTIDGKPSVTESAARTAYQAAGPHRSSFLTIDAQHLVNSFATQPESMCQVLRDLMGNPFRPTRVDPAWLTWNDRTVVRLAETAYNERQLPAGELAPDRLAVLADALEEAGCADESILGHLRGSGPHWRGCHVIDRLLGKE